MTVDADTRTAIIVTKLPWSALVIHLCYTGCGGKTPGGRKFLSAEHQQRRKQIKPMFHWLYFLLRRVYGTENLFYKQLMLGLNGMNIPDGLGSYNQT